MPKTYYDSELTAEQIENALTAIDGVVNPGNNGKVLYIEDGKIKAASASRWSGGYPEPTGTINISANGLVNVKDYAEANVQVPGGSEIEVIPLSVTANDTYTAPAGKAYSPVTVNVSGGGEDWLSLKNYIESSGTQYINSGYVPTANTKFEVIADVPDNTTAYPALFGERTSVQNEVVIFVEYGGGNIALVWANGDVVVTNDNIKQHYIGQKCKYVLSSDGFRCVINADGYGFLSEKTIGTFVTLPIFIFVLNDGGTANSVTFCSAKLYRFRIYEGNTLVHEFIPWQENGVACLKDTVTSNLLYNSGTGDFVYGTDA